MTDGMSAQINATLSSLAADIPEIESMGLVSREGRAINIDIPPEWIARGMDEDRISAMISGLVASAETSSNRFQKKVFHRVTIKLEDGYFTAVKVNDESYLFTIAQERVALGLLYYGMEKAAKALNYSGS